jgi:NADH pyrophosphatase NudC (nudix superfamily)
MKFCPNCGTVLTDAIIDETNVKKCKKCNYIDWNNWINISCVVVAYNENNEFLMVMLKGKEAGKITFPGGYRNLGETLEKAAIREFYEETGMIINQLELFNTYTKDEQRLVWVVYKAKLDVINFVENDEVSEIFFVSVENQINKEQLRGKLTEQLFYDLIKNNNPQFKKK